jgi:hydrophobic/amphiphilic exporter-1 (mainly G- bacteria), HAE1 family
MNITRFAIRRPVTISMFVVAVGLFGIVSLGRLPLNLLPDISYPSLTIQTDYEDAAPEEIESLITRPVEEGVGVVSGLTRLSSISRPGQSEVLLEFTWDTNMDMASIDVREKLDLIELPRDAGKPVILRFDPSYDPIMRVQLSGGMGLTRLRYIAEEEMKKRLEATDGVAAIKVAGGREEQIRIEIDEKRLAELGIPISEVTNILRAENLNQASGSLYDLDANYLVRMLNQFTSMEEIRNIIIRDQDGRKVVLGDVAEVWQGVKDRGVITRYNGKESVEMAVYKEGDANTVTVARAVKARLDAIAKEKTFPQGVTYNVVFNQADFISESVDNVLSAAWMGGLLATLVLFLFLRDLRSTVIIGLSIPISIMATFAAMYQTGISLNIMSLGGVALGVGMLVDNSIVVLESVHRHRGRHASLREEVYRGTTEVGVAVMASTLTTVAVFVPLVFVEGIAGQLFTDQALTITYSLLASLLVALTLIPVALAVSVRLVPPEAESSPAAVAAEAPQTRAGKVFWRVQTVASSVGRFLFRDMARTVLIDLRRLMRGLGHLLMMPLNPLLNGFDRWFTGVNEAYPRLISRALDNKGMVGLIVVASVVLAALISTQLGGELIPPLTQGQFSFQIEMPEGTPIQRTDAVVRDVETEAAKMPAIETVFSSVGGSQNSQFATGTLEENFAQLYVVMKNRRDRVAEQHAINEVRALLNRYPEVKHTFSRPTLFSFKTPVEVEIFAFDLGEQRAAAAKVTQMLQGIPGLSDIQSTTELGNPEVQVHFDRERLARYGLDESQVAQLLRNKIRGDVASRYREGDRQIDILVRVDENDRSSIGDLRDLVVNAPRSGANQSTPTPSPNNAAAGAGQSSGGAAQTAGLQTTGQQTAGQQNSAQQNSSQGGQQQQPQEFRPIRLGQIADVNIARGPGEIHRIRSQRAGVVSANLTGRDLNSVSAEIREGLARLRPELPASVTVGLGGQNEEIETSYRSLMFALSLAIFLVYLVMASQFESLVHPFIILFTVPLALVGVVFALGLTGTTVSVVVLLGVIVLAGIVVNNAIVLVDYANQLRDQGMPKREALVEAGRVRLRPIVMTTLTTVLGLLPMSFGWGEGAEVRAPMAITVMGGLIFSTLLTLVLIPVMYELLDRKVRVTADALPVRTETGAEPAMGESWQGAD